MSHDVFDFGMLGLGVMGRNLAWNIADHGFSVSVWNRELEILDEVLAQSEGKLHGTRTIEQFVGSLKRPRRIMVMITAGKAVDAVLSALIPLLQPGDIVIDGGNSFFEDTEKREERLLAHGLRYFGVGVSGGEEGARHGPSLMPGGDAQTYEELRPIFEAIAARTDSGSCVAYMGPGGAGHFVKMVHNGIEYADMQMLAEGYDILRRIGGFEPPALAETFARWNRGPLESFLVEITAQIFRVADPRREGWLIDRVLDKAGQKGTGRWTAEVALKLGVSVPSIAAAIDARVLSSMKEERQAAEATLRGPETPPIAIDPAILASKVQDALYAGKITAYAQGMALIAAAAEDFEWHVSLRETARIWKGGCIIRARLLDTIMDAYERNSTLPNLLLDQAIAARVHGTQAAWREVTSLALSQGVPVAALASGLAYYDSYRKAQLPQNLTQAQRDAFGAHTYRRVDTPESESFHTDWLDGRSD